MDIMELADRLREAVEGELDPGERVYWLAQPKASAFMVKVIPVVLFAIPWTAFAVFWTVMAFVAVGKGDDPTPFRYAFPAFGIPFILIGLGMFSAPLWMLRKARRTVYFITDRRAVIIEGGWGLSVRSYGPDKLKNIYRKERGRGTGSIIFEENRLDTSGRVSRRFGEIGFIAIEDVREVERALKKLAESGASG